MKAMTTRKGAQRMLGTLLAIMMLLAFTGFAQNNADNKPHVKYTKYQRQAIGFWRATPGPQTARVSWLVIGLGDSRDSVTVRWPTGLGCQTDPAEIQGNTITVQGGFPAVIQIHGSKTATVSMFGSQTILQMKKTKEATNFLCE
jgi:hypothetical protein